MHNYLLLSIIFLLFIGCTAEISKREAEEVIIRYYEAKGYKVTQLNIGVINPAPLNEKKYMGTPGYMVTVLSLTLQSAEPMGNIENYREEEKATFRNVRILIQQSTGPAKEWIIANMSGITIP